MTEPTGPQPSYELGYQSAPEFGSAPMLVRLAGIFNLVSAGLSVIAALYQLGMSVFMGYIMTRPNPGAPPPPPAARWIFYAIYGALAALALLAATVKAIGGVKLLRGGRGAWGWGLACGIVGCMELLWCSFGCVLPLAGGVYTIVILCLTNVRGYLARRGGGFEPVMS